MANQQEIEEAYDFMDEIFRLSFGEHADLTCAMFQGDFSKTLAQAQRDKHDYILEGIGIKPGMRVLDIGSGFGPMLKAVQERGGHAIGLTLSRKQAQGCKRAGLEVYVKDWKEVTVDTFGTFDGIVSVGAFEHFCSVEEYLAGKQDGIYDHFFRLCHDLLPPGGRLYLQTMMLGKNAPALEHISLQAQEGSNEYIAAIAMEFFPGSWLPFGEEHILRVAAPYFEQISHNNGRLDYIHTIEEWSKLWNFTFSNFKNSHARFARSIVVAKLIPRFLMDRDFRRRTEFLRKGYDKECFRREIIDHQRMVFQKK
nr:class I SAM-dependent methyltransferase [Ktedonobacteraceae bacterium]